MISGRTERDQLYEIRKQGEIQTCFQFSAVLTNLLTYLWFEGINLRKQSKILVETRENILKFSNSLIQTKMNK